MVEKVKDATGNNDNQRYSHAKKQVQQKESLICPPKKDLLNSQKILTPGARNSYKIFYT